MKRCIIKNDDKFEVMGFEGDDYPVEAVLAPNENYFSVKNNVKFSWTYSPRAFFIISYRDNEIENLWYPNAHAVVDYMNKYYDMTIEELEKKITA